MRFLAITLLGVLLLGAVLLLGPALRGPRTVPAGGPGPAEAVRAPASEPPASPRSPERIRVGLSSETTTRPTERPNPEGAIEISGTVGRYHSWLPAEPVPEARVEYFLGGEEEVASTDSGRDDKFAFRVAGAAVRVPARVRVVASKDGLLSWSGGIHEFEVDAIPFRLFDLRLYLYTRGELRGRVLEAYGDVPIRGARVELLQESWASGARRLVPRGGVAALSDELGWFAIERPADPIFMDFQASAPGHLSVLLRVSPLRPPPDGIHLVRLPRTEDQPRIEGTVRDAEGRPIEGARVTLGRPSGIIEGAPSLSEALTAHGTWLGETGGGDGALRTVTGAEGRYSFGVWPLGVWEVAAVKEGMGEAKSVEVLQPGVHVRDFRLTGRPVTFVGTVRARATGLPVPKAQVGAEGDGARWLERSAWSADESGTFRCGPGPREPIRFYVKAMGFAPRTVEAVPDDAGAETQVVVELDEEGRLLGRVVDRTKAPLPRAQVWVGRSPGRYFSSGQTGGDGSFELRMLPAGERLLLSVHPPEVGLAPRTLEVTLERAGEVRDLGTIVLAPK